jgi:hypothetical protein
LVAVLVGTLQTLMGLHGFLRATGYCWRGDETDHSALWWIGFVWIVSTFLQFVFQPAYGDDDEYQYNAEGATVACVYIGFFAMPALLDYLIRHTPVQPRPEYYGLEKDAPYREDLPTQWLGMVPTTPPTRKEDGDGNEEEGRKLPHRGSFDATAELTCSFPAK